MKSKVLLTRAGFGCLLITGLALASPNAHAGKPAPPPAKPPAIAYEQKLVQAGIYTMAADGSSRTLVLKNTGSTVYREPCISPDGTKMAFSRGSSAGMELCVSKLNGTSLAVVHTFTSDQDFPSWWMVVWSPDGTKLLFNSPSRAEDLLYIDLANSGVVQAVPVDLVPVSGPMTISGDIDSVTPGYQGKLAVSGGTGADEQSIRILDLTFDEAGVPQIGPTVLSIETIANVRLPSWSPTGDFLAYIGVGGPDHMDLDGLHLIGMVRAGSEIAPVGDWNVCPMARLDSRIAWSPDGQYVAFSGTLNPANYDQILRATVSFDALGQPMASDVKALTTYTKVWEVDPSWSPAWVAGP